MSACPICDGVGLVRVMSDAGLWVSRPCECQKLERNERLLAAAHIPERYEHCSLDSYSTEFRTEYGPNAFKQRHSTEIRRVDPSLGNALMMARAFVKEYGQNIVKNPVSDLAKNHISGDENRGLLITGSIGVGKTHIAVGILKRLILDYGVRGFFCDYRELLKKIQDSWNPQVQTTELEILRPLFNVDILVLDDLGAQKPTDWIWENVALILNSRYNGKKVTIITTNYPDRLAGKGEKTDAERAARELTLGDRIGDRMLSRLAEMCIPIEIKGEDFRQRIKGRRFHSVL